MAERFFGNMTDEEYEEWKSLSKEDRKKLARELALEKRRAKKIKEAQDAAYWKNYRKESQVEKGTDKFRLFPELQSQQPIFNEDYSLETSPEGLSAQALANDKLTRGLSNIGAMGEDAPGYGANVKKDDEPGFFSMKTLRDWGLIGDLKATTAKINRENTPIPENVILEGRIASKLNKHPYDADEFSDIEEEPISEFDQEIIDNKLKAAKFSGLSTVDDGAINPEEQAADARRFQREYEEAAFPEEPSWTKHLIAGGDKKAMKQINEDLGKLVPDPVTLKLAAAAFIESKLSPSLLGKKTRSKIIDSIIPPITKEEAKNHNKNNKEGLINTSKDEVLKELVGDGTQKELKKIIEKEEKIDE